jgi:hypothetical protein
MIGVGCDHAVSQTEYPEDKQKATEADKELFDSLWP